MIIFLYIEIMVGETLLYVIALLFAVMLLVILGQKLRIAYPVFLVIGGLLISQIPGTPRSGISPDLIFLIFLPPLLYEAAWFTSWPNFWRMRWPIGLHGFGLVIVTSVIVAFVSEKLDPQIYFVDRPVAGRDHFSTGCRGSEFCIEIF